MKFEVEARIVRYCSAVIEADSLEEAEELARDYEYITEHLEPIYTRPMNTEVEVDSVVPLDPKEANR
jgi:hypothetical protein